MLAAVGLIPALATACSSAAESTPPVATSRDAGPATAVAPAACPTPASGSITQTTAGAWRIAAEGVDRAIANAATQGPMQTVLPFLFGRPHTFVHQVETELCRRDAAVHARLIEAVLRLEADYAANQGSDVLAGHLRTIRVELENAARAFGQEIR
jgi:hypothetical protein